jgi:hypothetical protein
MGVGGVELHIKKPERASGFERVDMLNRFNMRIKLFIFVGTKVSYFFDYEKNINKILGATYYNKVPAILRSYMK